MNRYCHLASALGALMLSSAAQAAPATSHFPATGLGSFLTEKFDLASIRSSVGPRRTPATRTFADLGIKPSRAGDDSVTLERGNWFYEFRIVERRDVNGDGIEDLKACFVDRAVGSPTYHAMKGLLITRYAADGYALALSFQVDDACEMPGYLSGPGAR